MSCSRRAVTTESHSPPITSSASATPGRCGTVGRRAAEETDGDGAGAPARCRRARRTPARHRRRPPRAQPRPASPRAAGQPHRRGPRRSPRRHGGERLTWTCSCGRTVATQVDVVRWSSTVAVLPPWGRDCPCQSGRPRLGRSLVESGDALGVTNPTRPRMVGTWRGRIDSAGGRPWHGRGAWGWSPGLAKRDRGGDRAGARPRGDVCRRPRPDVGSARRDGRRHRDHRRTGDV